MLGAIFEVIPFRLVLLVVVVFLGVLGFFFDDKKFFGPIPPIWLVFTICEYIKANK